LICFMGLARRTNALARSPDGQTLAAARHDGNEKGHPVSWGGLS
jgi:hypothetical protein